MSRNVVLNAAEPVRCRCELRVAPLQVVQFGDGVHRLQSGMSDIPGKAVTQ